MVHGFTYDMVAGACSEPGCGHRCPQKCVPALVYTKCVRLSFETRMKIVVLSCNSGQTYKKACCESHMCRAKLLACRLCIVSRSDLALNVVRYRVHLLLCLDFSLNRV